MFDSGEQEFNELLARFGDQAPTLRHLLEGIGNPLQVKINATEARLKVAEEEMEQLRAKNAALSRAHATAQPTDLGTVLEAIRGISQPVQDAKIDVRAPDTFKGEAAKVEPLLMAARTYFSLKPRACPTDRGKIVWVLQFFVERAEP